VSIIAPNTLAVPELASLVTNHPKCLSRSAIFPRFKHQHLNVRVNTDNTSSQAVVLLGKFSQLRFIRTPTRPSASSMAAVGHTNMIEYELHCTVLAGAPEMIAHSPEHGSIKNLSQRMPVPIEDRLRKSKSPPKILPQPTIRTSGPPRTLWLTRSGFCGYFLHQSVGEAIEAIPSMD